MIKLYDTRLRQKVDFEPVKPGKVAMYVCGPTVYNRIHIGNARTFISFDMIRRYLEWAGYEVTFVQNVTDVDDKIIKRANEEGITSGEVAEKYIQEYFTDAKALGVRPATIHPKATENIPQIIEIVQTLIDKGYAYATANGDVARWGEAAEADIDALSASVSTQVGEARGRLTLVYIISLVTSALTLALGIFLVAAALRIIRRYVLTPIRDAMGTLQDSSERISGVVGEVRRRAKHSNDSVRSLSGLTQQLSAALEEIAGSAAAITASAAGTQGDTQSMAQECSAITAYSAGMRERAEEMERSARLETQVIRDKTADIMAMLDQAIEKSHSVEQIRSLTEDILSISSSTNLIAVNASIEAARAGAAGAGFSVVAQEVHKLADSCAETANHIQKVSEVVTGAVDYLAGSARELADYLGRVIAEQLERSVQAGQQYREDSDYIGSAMEEFNDRAERLKSAIDQIAVSISSISGSIDGAASGISGAAGSTRILVDDMEGITGRMDANQEIVGELQKQMDMFANL